MNKLRMLVIALAALLLNLATGFGQDAAQPKVAIRMEGGFDKAQQAQVAEITSGLPLERVTIILSKSRIAGLNVEISIKTNKGEKAEDEFGLEGTLAHDWPLVCECLKGCLQKVGLKPTNASPYLVGLSEAQSDQIRTLSKTCQTATLYLIHDKSVHDGSDYVRIMLLPNEGERQTEIVGPYAQDLPHFWDEVTDKVSDMIKHAKTK